MGEEGHRNIFRALLSLVVSYSIRLELLSNQTLWVCEFRSGKSSTWFMSRSQVESENKLTKNRRNSNEINEAIHILSTTKIHFVRSFDERAVSSMHRT